MIVTEKRQYPTKSNNFCSTCNPFGFVPTSHTSHLSLLHYQYKTELYVALLSERIKISDSTQHPFTTVKKLQAHIFLVQKKIPMSNLLKLQTPDRPWRWLMPSFSLQPQDSTRAILSSWRGPYLSSLFHCHTLFPFSFLKAFPDVVLICQGINATDNGKQI